MPFDRSAPAALQRTQPRSTRIPELCHVQLPQIAQRVPVRSFGTCSRDLIDDASCGGQLVREREDQCEQIGEASGGGQARVGRIEV